MGINQFCRMQNYWYLCERIKTYLLYFHNVSTPTQKEFHFNPFDTEHRAKIAVKFGILRVVMLWPSQS